VLISPSARAFATIVCIASLTPRSVAAQPSPDDSAQRWFDRGLALADQRRWDDAIAAFEHARAISPLPAVLFNLAEARRRANRPREALEAYVEYLDRATAPSNYRTLALQRVVELERRVARVRLDVAPAEATVHIDDRDVTGRAQVLLDAGPHAIAVRASGYEPEVRTMTLGDGERATLVVHLSRRDVVAAPSTPVVPPEAPPPPPPPVVAAPRDDTTYRNAFQLALVTHAILDEDGLGVGFGARVGMRLARSWELVLGLSHEYTNGVGYVVGGAGFYYVSHAASPIAVYMGTVLGVLVPQCTTSCEYTTSRTTAQTDMALQVTAGARFEIMRWFGPFIELNGGLARFSDPIPLIYFGSGVQFSLPL
jgi:PEGA domain